jgi:tRNA nucleotidyltransferase (CCA-adding enzyme)
MTKNNLIKYKQGDKVDLPDKVKELIKIFHKNKFEIYIVGGTSRGILTGYPIADWDFATNALPSQMQQLFPKNHFYNNQFGTVSIVMGKQKKDIFEVTTFRTEKEYQDFRRPESVVWGKSIEEDLSRRDFTINAIALKFKVQNEKCKIEKLIDPYSGIEDLENRIIKAVGDPDKRFNEDALRLLRAVRIATQLGFTIENKTFQSIKKNAGLINKIAWERIRDEFLKLLSSDHPADGIILLHNTELLNHIMPELIKGKGLDQPKHHISTVWRHCIDCLRYCPSADPIVRLAALLHDIGKPVTAKGEGDERTFYNHEVVGAAIAKEIGKRLRLSNDQVDKLWRLVRWHQFAPNEELSDSAIRRFIRRVGKDNLNDILDIRTGDRLGSGVPATSWRTELFKKRLKEVQKRPFSVKDLKVNGNDVMKVLNIPPGPEVGQILEALFEEVKDKKDKNNRDYLISQIPEVAEKLGIK